MSEKKKAVKVNAVKGMNDMLPADAGLWELVENTVQSVVKSYGYQQMRTPIVEDTGLFVRGLGEVTDIVEKEMYTFIDSLNGDSLTLRPEGTAGAVRAVIEHNLTYDSPKRLWYYGPMFRHERPQRGRYRQFYQFGLEAVGFTGPDIDAELILLCRRLWDDLGLQDVELHLNSIGDASERAEHRAALIAYFEKHQDQLDEDAKRRLYSNPLRILDTKNPHMQKLVDGAPKLLDYLKEESRAHFEGVRAILDKNAVPYIINPRLVRGMDYYNRTVFEWVTTKLGSQGTICGGGRYDPLIEMCGGKPTPACGFAMGVERIIELLKEEGADFSQAQCDVYLVHQGAEAQSEAMVLGERLRDAGLDVVLHCAGANGMGNFKAQMKRADASGAAYALILGEDEIAKGVAAVKNLRGEQGEQQQAEVALEEVVEYVVDAIISDDAHEHLHLHP
ncbi:histidine--tRNA ligase [Massilia sp. W12]|uniref:histidine--tRNA ligase n=1 Tax=Massilia sp. W12 TaxID=3126507 RepID=UPI0030D43A4E